MKGRADGYHMYFKPIGGIILPFKSLKKHLLIGKLLLDNRVLSDGAEQWQYTARSFSGLIHLLYVGRSLPGCSFQPMKYLKLSACLRLLESFC